MLGDCVTTAVAEAAFGLTLGFVRRVQVADSWLSTWLSSSETKPAITEYGIHWQ
jgi:lactate dehydrogenase-like 2-hydroxyacid dehydrogenase